MTDDEDPKTAPFVPAPWLALAAVGSWSLVIYAGIKIHDLVVAAVALAETWWRHL